MQSFVLSGRLDVTAAVLGFLLFTRMCKAIMLGYLAILWLAYDTYFCGEGAAYVSYLLNNDFQFSSVHCFTLSQFKA